MITRSQLNSPLGLSLAAIAVTSVFALYQAPAVLGALMAPRAASLEDAQKLLDQKLDEHVTDHNLAKARFNGRALFFLPSRPIDRTPTPVEEVKPAGPPPKPPDPTSYGGNLTDPYLFGDSVVFKVTGQENRISLRPGEEKDGVKLLSIDSSWLIKVRWKEMDWDIKLFERLPTTEQLFDKTAAPAGTWKPEVVEPEAARAAAAPARGGRSGGKGGDGFQKPELPPLPPEEEKKKSLDPPA